MAGTGVVSLIIHHTSQRYEFTALLLSKMLSYDLKAHLIAYQTGPQLWETGGRLFSSSGANNWRRVSFAAPPFAVLALCSPVSLSLSLTGNTDCITETSAAEQHSRTLTPTRKP